MNRVRQIVFGDITQHKRMYNASEHESLVDELLSIYGGIILENDASNCFHVRSFRHGLV